MLSARQDSAFRRFEVNGIVFDVRNTVLFADTRVLKWDTAERSHEPVIIKKGGSIPCHPLRVVLASLFAHRFSLKRFLLTSWHGTC